MGGENYFLGLLESTCVIISFASPELTALTTLHNDKNPPFLGRKVFLLAQRAVGTYLKNSRSPMSNVKQRCVIN